MHRRHALSLPFLALAAPVAAPARAAEWPERAIRVVVPYAPGGNADIVGRLLCQHLSDRLGQQAVVENRSGAAGNLGAAAVAKARPDGYTLLVAPNGPLALNSLVMARMPYDPATELLPIGMISRVAMCVVVSAQLPIRNVQELIAYDRAHPGELTAGSAGTGSSNHIALEMFNAKAGTRLTHVPYRGSAPAITDLLGGRLPVYFDQLTTAIPLLREGQARILAVTTKERSPLLPAVPTLAESGLDDYEIFTYLALVAPTGTPAEVVGRLARELSAVLDLPAMKAKIEEMGGETADATLRTPGGCAAFLRADRERANAIAARAGLRPE
ncbi:Bug family tripartite tricarboxylate transporter substrate binding protein [Rhodovarius crocodyli]|nr:tripartite tricarboxylate transporter substrate binding protein [Rhodovarius crocodyli]